MMAAITTETTTRDAARAQAIVRSLRGIDEGLAWQGRVLRAMGGWMGRTDGEYVRDCGDLWLAVHSITIGVETVTVEWELLERGRWEWFSRDAGATTLTRHDREWGDVTDEEWWEELHRQLRIDARAEWAVVQMVGDVAQTLQWGVSH